MAGTMRFNLETYILEQIQWSAKTFGKGPRTAGLIDHIKKELVEIADNPEDLYEWADVVILALDGAWRCGYTPRQICNALARKARINRDRDWGPDLGDGKAIEHVRSKGDRPGGVIEDGEEAEHRTGGLPERRGA